MAAMPMRLIEVQSMGQDLAQKTVCVKVRLGRLGNTRKVSNSQVEVDTDKSLLLISKHLLDSKELRTIAAIAKEMNGTVGPETISGVGDLIAQLTARLEEQTAQIQNVSAQLGASKPAPQVVNNP